MGGGEGDHLVANCLKSGAVAYKGYYPRKAIASLGGERNAVIHVGSVYYQLTLAEIAVSELGNAVLVSLHNEKDLGEVVALALYELCSQIVYVGGDY